MIIRIALVLSIGAGLAGCAAPVRQRAPASSAALAACRVEVDRVYAAQNRVDLSRRDQRDTPFAAGYNSGITTRGLSAEYGRDNMVQSCLNASADTPAVARPAPGPTFTPAAR